MTSKLGSNQMSRFCKIYIILIKNLFILDANFLTIILRNQTQIQSLRKNEKAINKWKQKTIIINAINKSHLKSDQIKT